MNRIDQILHGDEEDEDSVVSYSDYDNWSEVSRYCELLPYHVLQHMNYGPGDDIIFLCPLNSMFNHNKCNRFQFQGLARYKNVMEYSSQSLPFSDM